MNETLTIRNFGPIKDMSFELRVVNILIGDQGTGKSTVAKLLFVIKEMLSIGDSNTERLESDWNLIHFKEQLEIVGIRNYLEPRSFIEFRDSFGYFKFDNSNIEFKIIESEGKNKRTYLAGYIPSYREAVPLLKNSLNAIAAISTTLQKLFYLFGQKVDNAKTGRPIYNYNDVLDVSYKYVNGMDIIIMKNGEEINIEEASSAINSVIPLLLAFDNAIESMYRSGNRIYHYTNEPYLIIEEPELNCFPKTQKKIVEHFISNLKFESKDGLDYYLRLIITTHSPYILTSLNNLMYAYAVGQKEPEEANKIIDKKYWMNPGDVSTYMLLSNGKCIDIFDREQGLIEAEKIDSVTNILNEQFSSLLNLQFSENEFDTN